MLGLKPFFVMVQWSIFMWSAALVAQAPRPGFDDSGLELMKSARVVQSSWDHDADQDNFLELAKRIVDGTNQTLISCGLYLMNPRHPFLQVPQVPADMAIANRLYRVIAYYDFVRGTLGHTHLYKNPNGSHPHRVDANINELRVSDPYGGLSARAYKNTENSSNETVYLCEGKVVDFDGFVSCVNQRFISLVERQLCRFSK